jgi:hypothetical protein
MHCRGWYVCEKRTIADKVTALFVQVAIFCLPIHFVGSWPCQKICQPVAMEVMQGTVSCGAVLL